MSNDRTFNISAYLYFIFVINRVAVPNIYVQICIYIQLDYKVVDS